MAVASSHKVTHMPLLFTGARLSRAHKSTADTAPFALSTLDRNTLRYRAIAVLLAAALLASALVASAAPTHAAPGSSGTVYNGSSSVTGGTVPLVGVAAEQRAGYYGVNPSYNGYILLPGIGTWSGNTAYDFFEWDTAALSQTAAGVRGEVEWILKNSLPTRTAIQVRNAAFDAGYPVPSGSPNIAIVARATSAAIWYYTAGTELDESRLVSTTDNNRLIQIYRYLVDTAAGQAATISGPRAVDVSNPEARTTFVIDNGAQFGPFTVESSGVVNLTSTNTNIRIVDADGAALVNPVAPGASFWLQEISPSNQDGSVTVTATLPATTARVPFPLVPRQEAQANRGPLVALSNVTYPALVDTVIANWQIDTGSAGSFDPDGQATEREFVHNRPGELSPTLQRIVFTDGTSVDTDLIGLSGVGGASSLDAYSIDFDRTYSEGVRGPAVRDQSRYTEVDWHQGNHPAAADRAEAITWILENSYPYTSTASLTAAIREGGYQAPSGNITIWEAIAATQAAIWHFSDGKELDTTRYGQPIEVSSSATGSPLYALLHQSDGSNWQAEEAGEVAIDFTFLEPYEIRNYQVELSSTGSLGNAPSSWRLERSADGVTYTPVSSSATTRTVSEAGEIQNTVLGASATVGGYEHYRLILTPAVDSAEPLEIGSVWFDGFAAFPTGIGSNWDYRKYANPSPVVGAYQYLIAAAPGDVQFPTDPVVEIEATTTSVERVDPTTLIGPFTLNATTAASVTAVDADDDAVTYEIIPTASGTPTTEALLSAGDTFWVNPGSADSVNLRIHAEGSAVNWTTARALNGDRLDTIQATLVTLGVQSARGRAVLDVQVSLAPVTIATDAVNGESQRGEVVNLNGTGFLPSETVVITLHSDSNIVAQTVADAEGNIAASFIVPAEATIGDQTLVAVGQESQRSAQTSLRILAADADVSGGEDGTDSPVTVDPQEDSGAPAGEPEDGTLEPRSLREALEATGQGISPGFLLGVVFLIGTGAALSAGAWSRRRAS